MIVLRLFLGKRFREAICLFQSNADKLPVFFKLFGWDDFQSQERIRNGHQVTLHAENRDTMINHGAEFQHGNGESCVVNPPRC